MRHDETTPTTAVVLQPLKPDDLTLVDRMLDGLRAFSMRTDGVARTKDGALRFLTEAPAGYGVDAKHVFAVRLGTEPVGLVDLIRGYPEPGTAFIGLLAIVETHQGRGFGRATLEAVERFAQEELGASKLRLAVVSTNPVLGFWRRVGFRETGEVRSFSGERTSGDACLLEKIVE